MTTSARRRPQHRLSGPAELLQAIPYLLGFHPHASLVLLGLDAGELLVTARLDLLDAVAPAVLDDTVEALHRGGSEQILAAIYPADSGSGDIRAGDGWLDDDWLDDDWLDDPLTAGPPSGSWSDEDSMTDSRLPDNRMGANLTQEGDLGWDGSSWAALPHELSRVCSFLRCELLDVLIVQDGRWWSHGCDTPACCPPEGRALPESPSAFTAAATVEGVVALDSRAALAASLDPLPDDRRHELDVPLATAEDAAFDARLGGHAQRRARSVKRALFAAARAFDEPPAAALDDEDVCRFAVALSEIALRDAIWVAIDAGRLDGRGLWRELARRCPAPYDAAALFLFGWASWRAGNGALAGIAAERAIASDAGYTAADLLLAALSRGLDPRSFPKLRLPRPA